MELKINYSKAREIAPEMTIGKENFVLLQHTQQLTCMCMSVPMALKPTGKSV